MAHYSSSSSSPTLPVLAPQPSYPSDSDASTAASSRAPVAWQSRHILASDPSIHFYLGASHHGAPDDHPSLELTLYKDPWMIKKLLTTSDGDMSCWLLLLTDDVEKHVLSSMNEEDVQLCRTRRGKEFEVWDADTSSPHTLVLGKWFNSCFVLTGGWENKFVNRRGLNAGDEIGLFWDGARFHFKLLNRN